MYESEDRKSFPLSQVVLLAESNGFQTGLARDFSCAWSIEENKQKLMLQMSKLVGDPFPDRLVLSIDENRKINGFCFYSAHEPNNIHISLLLVDKPHRGRKIGKSLIMAVCKYHTLLSEKKLVVTLKATATTESIKFWTAAKFEFYTWATEDVKPRLAQMASKSKLQLNDDMLNEAKKDACGCLFTESKFDVMRRDDGSFTMINCLPNLIQTQKTIYK